MSTYGLSQRHSFLKISSLHREWLNRKDSTPCKPYRPRCVYFHSADPIHLACSLVFCVPAFPYSYAFSGLALTRFVYTSPLHIQYPSRDPSSSAILRLKKSTLYIPSLQVHISHTVNASFVSIRPPHVYPFSSMCIRSPRVYLAVVCTYLPTR